MNTNYFLIKAKNKKHFSDYRKKDSFYESSIYGGYEMCLCIPEEHEDEIVWDLCGGPGHLSYALKNVIILDKNKKFSPIVTELYKSEKEKTRKFEICDLSKIKDFKQISENFVKVKYLICNPPFGDKGTPIIRNIFCNLLQNQHLFLMLPTYCVPQFELFYNKNYLHKPISKEESWGFELAQIAKGLDLKYDPINRAVYHPFEKLNHQGAIFYFSK